MRYTLPSPTSEIPMDSISEDRLSQVHPLLASKVRQMAELLAQEGIVVRVIQGLRSWDEQAALYAKGRTAPGPVVTNADAGFSWHNYGLAVDLVPMTPLGPDWSITHPTWQRMIAVGTSVGLVSGSVWRSFPDYPHFQLTGSLPVSPSPLVRSVYMEGSLEAVWQASGLDGAPGIMPDVDGEISV